MKDGFVQYRRLTRLSYLLPGQTICPEARARAERRWRGSEMRCQVQEGPEQPSILHGRSLKTKAASRMPSHTSVQAQRHKSQEGKLKRATDTDQTARPGVGSGLKGASFFFFFWLPRIEPIDMLRSSSRLLLATHTARMAADRRRRRTAQTV